MHKRLSLATLGPLAALIALIILGASLNDNFLSSANITNVLARSAFIGMISVGMTFVITSGGIDLSVGSMVAFVAGMMIIVMNWLQPMLGIGLPLVLAGIAAALIIGFLAGLLNGLLVTGAGIEPFIVTLGTMGIFRSLVTWLADGGTLSLDFSLRQYINPIYFGGIFGISWPIIIFAIVVVLGHIIMRHTRFGRYCEAIGSNDKVARYAAVNVGLVLTVTYVALGFLVGLATVLYVPRLGSASGATAFMWELESIAAVIIGGTSLKGGTGRIWGTVIGVLILSLIGNILNLASLVSPYLNGTFQGIIIVLAVVLQRKESATTR